MPKLPRNAPIEKKREAASEEMREFSRGELHSGSKEGPIVTKPAQAKAIAMSVSGQSRKDRTKKRSKRRKTSRGGRSNARR